MPNQVSEILTQCGTLRDQLRAGVNDPGATILNTAGAIHHQLNQTQQLPDSTRRQLETWGSDVQAWMMVAEQSGYSTGWANALEKIAARAPQWEEA